jgi:hypothetical protein
MEVGMISASRSWILAASAIALMSSQASWASPVKTAPTVDPLVSLSLLQSAQSRAAVCGTDGACALPPGMQASMVTPTAVAASASAAGMQYPAERRIGVDWPGLFVLFAVPVAITLAIALEDSGNDNRPISPA